MPEPTIPPPPASGAFQHARIMFVNMVCSGPSHHPRRLKKRVIFGSADDGSFGSAYYLVAPDIWSPAPVCDKCDSFLDEERFLSTSVQVRESDRAVFFVSSDGQRVAVPGVRDGRGFEESKARRLSQGYTVVEPKTMRDIDRLDRIRAAQTGNDAYNEMNYNAGTREVRQSSDEYDDTDMTRDY